MTAIWRDRDFRALDEAAQRWYLMLVTQPEITAAGVLITRVDYWASLATDSKVDHAHQVLARLDAKMFVVTDWETNELLVRSFIRWDAGYNNPKRRPVIMKAAREVISERLAWSLTVEFAACGLPAIGPGRPSDVLQDALPDSLSSRASRGPNDSNLPRSFTGTDPFLLHDPRFPPSSQVDRLSGRASDGLTPSEGSAVTDVTGSDTATRTPQSTTHEPPQAPAPSSDAAAPTEQPPEQPSERSQQDAVIDELCNLLVAKIVENGFRPVPTIGKTWRRDMRLLIELDERPPAKIRKMIEWLSGDEFWAPNVKSPGKLRAQWDKLAAKANSEYERARRNGGAVAGPTYNGVAPSGRVPTTTQKIADTQALKELFR